MEEYHIKKLLRGVRAGKITINEALEELKELPFQDLDFATIDSHRALRLGFPEVVFGQGKTSQQIADIIKKMAAGGNNVLATRVDKDKVTFIKKTVPGIKYDPVSRTMVLKKHPVRKQGKGSIMVVSAGTSDIPVAEEAYVTAQLMGNKVEKLYDVGVAGIHRVLDKRDKLKAATVLVVVAGMEGALASVIGGLVAKPIIAVPTSSGYGTSLGGISALLGMLNSCVPSVAVVNIDNGFGAGYIASLINRG
ncbi:MAG: nickel pincer cofactor biosynthesis protein LarB [Deltaproteobacteria bacterium]|nr:MAG: nickel pincer cofactor biosynthesis protein LarB [Deltaproteobacteria bacterium]